MTEIKHAGQRCRERVQRILQRRGGGEVALDALGGLQALMDGLDVSDQWREYCRSGEIRYVGLEPASGDRTVYGPYLPELPPAADISCWGVGRIALQNAQGHHAGHQYYHPLAGINTLAELEAYPFPDVDATKTPEELQAEVAALQAEGFTVVGNLSQTILETAYLMRGMDQLFCDFYERPAYLHRLFERLCEQRLVQARRFAAAGVDAVRLGDDIATQQGLMVSLPMYREFLRPYHEAVVAAVLAGAPEMAVAYHSDGNLTPLLPDLIAIGVTAINPVQPECMDLLETRREFGRDLTLWGCTPVQSTYAYGTPAEVTQQTRFLLEEVAAEYGLIIQFMNIVLTETVLANLPAFFMELARWGEGQ